MTEGPTAASEIVLHLPWPPALSQYFRVFRGRKIRSAKARTYTKDVEAAVMDQLGQHKPLAGRIRVGVQLCRGDARKYDLDNTQKAILDALAHAGVYEDDAQIDKLEIERGPLDRPHGSAIVVIRTLSEPE